MTTITIIPQLSKPTFIKMGVLKVRFLKELQQLLKMEDASLP
jgi:hypothetical protein